MAASYGSAVAAAMRSGNYVAAGGDAPAAYADLNETSRQDQARHAALLRRVDAEKRARRIVVPTGDNEVRAMLRKLGHPVRLFGESAADVRERLRSALARVEIEGEDRELVAALLAQPSVEELQPRANVPRRGKEDVYSAASRELVGARRSLAPGTFDRAKRRLTEQRRHRDDAAAVGALDEAASSTFAKLRSLALAQSQAADARPVASVRSAPTQNLVCTGGWSGSVKIWDAAKCECIKSVKAHADRCTGVSWAPDSSFIATCGADGEACVWDLEGDAPRARLRGHRARLGGVAVHPVGRHVATTSFDHTWRLWDIETGVELLLQDGHGCEVYGVAWQPDGSIICTGDFAGLICVWDVRSGKRIHHFQGHSGKVLCLDWHRDGFHVASGSDDHTARAWDLRRRCEAYVLPAHSSLIADVRWAPASGEALVTAGFDGNCRVWRHRDWALLNDLKAHDGKCMACDFGPNLDDGVLATAGYDRTFKLWAGGDDGLGGYR